MTLPADFFTGYQLLANAEAAPAQGIFIPLTSLSGLTAAEADEGTGDGRKVAFELVRTVNEKYNALAAADRPTRMSVTVGTPTGINSTTVRRTYTMTFDVDIAATDLASEPNP